MAIQIPRSHTHSINSHLQARFEAPPLPMVATADNRACSRSFFKTPGPGFGPSSLKGAALHADWLHKASWARGANRNSTARRIGCVVPSSGMKHPEPRIQMLHGSDEGWNRFRGRLSRTPHWLDDIEW